MTPPADVYRIGLSGIKERKATPVYISLQQIDKRLENELYLVADITLNYGMRQAIKVPTTSEVKILIQA